MTSLSTVAPKLQKLIPLLSTNSEGEALACVAAILRTLSSAGLTVHDLAEALGPCASQPARQHVSRFGPPVWGRLCHLDRLEWLAAIQRVSEYGAWQYQFCEGIARQIARGVSLSPKQAASAQSVLSDAWKRGLRP